MHNQYNHNNQYFILNTPIIMEANKPDTTPLSLNTT
jgi:hypothetical protein